MRPARSRISRPVLDAVYRADQIELEIGCLQRGIEEQFGPLQIADAPDPQRAL